MKFLTSFSLENCEKTEANYLSRIYKACGQLKSLNFRQEIDGDQVQFFEQMIESMKSDLIQRTSPLILILSSDINI